MSTSYKQVKEHPPSKIRDRIGGIVVAVTGLITALEALNYSFGKISRMGPGMTPFGLGVILVILGIMIFIFARPSESSEDEKPRLRPVALPLAGILAFALLVDRAGLVPATFAIVFISGLADPDHTVKSLAGLFGFLIVLVWIVFVNFIGVPFRMIVGVW